MGKLATGMALGFLAGMKYHDAGKKLCLKKLKKQCMRRMGL